MTDSGLNPERHPDVPLESGITGARYGRGPTTHSEFGAGNPRLVMLGVEDDAQRVVFPLTRIETRIGSASDNHIVLEGLLPHHATITHTEADEYVLDSLGETETSSAGEESPYEDAPKGARLRHGSTLKIAGWSFSFQRQEFADHGRPFAGREGGEFSRQPLQGSPPDYSEAYREALARERMEDAARLEHLKAAEVDPEK